MLAIITYKEQRYEIDLAKPHDISYPLIPGAQTPKCFWAPDVSASPVRSGDWVGSTAEGGIVNFYDVKINPHGNGTHTECVGHIAQVQHSVQDSFEKYHFVAQLITLNPTSIGEDRVITAEQIKATNLIEDIEAAIIRTSPNDIADKNIDYSESNPPYLEPAAIKLLADHGIQHLLIDLPSVDREVDEGKLLAHRAFWDYPANTHDKKSITELVFIDNAIQDDLYLLEMQIAPLVMDASPSRPVIYQMDPIKE